MIYVPGNSLAVIGLVCWLWKLASSVLSWSLQWPYHFKCCNCCCPGFMLDRLQPNPRHRKPAFLPIVKLMCACVRRSAIARACVFVCAYTCMLVCVHVWVCICWTGTLWLIAYYNVPLLHTNALQLYTASKPQCLSLIGASESVPAEVGPYLFAVLVVWFFPKSEIIMIVCLSKSS